MTLTKKEAAKLRKLDRKVLNGKATTKEVLDAIDLQNKKKMKGKNQ